MNEKIRELALKYAQQLDWDPPAGPKTYTFIEAGIDKFAKSIITECCSATEGQPRSEIRNSILKRFGLTVPDLSYKEIKNEHQT